MSNTVTYKGHKDPTRTEYVAATAGGMQFRLGVKVDDVPDKVVKELEAMTDHEFEFGTASGGYASRKVDELRAEAEKRGLTVEGSGTDGQVVKADLVAALEAHDTEQ